LWFIQNSTNVARNASACSLRPPLQPEHQAGTASSSVRLLRQEEVKIVLQQFVVSLLRHDFHGSRDRNGCRDSVLREAVEEVVVNGQFDTTAADAAAIQRGKVTRRA
jgi:hypothetical protein